MPNLAGQGTAKTFLRESEMPQGEGSAVQPIITVPIEFYRGVKAIAKFLEMHPETVKKLLREGKIPAKKDETGRWVLTNLDYYQSLQG